MPARWQSSQRPLFVRTVWVNGRRHAILSRDDPLLQYPRPSSSNGSSDTSSEGSTCCQLEDCLIKLRLALQPESYQGTYQESIFPIHSGTIESSHCYDHEDSDSLYDEDFPRQRLPLLGQYRKFFSFDRSDPAPILPEQLNPLSERVLQWLDLSNKGKRLNTAVELREVELTRERRKSSTTDIRKTHISRRKELPTRSLSMDVLANIKLSARSLDTHSKHKTICPAVVTTPRSLEIEEPQVKKALDDPPIIQNFEPPRLLRPMTAWPQPPTPNRPQLHIFMPPLVDGGKIEDNSECESTVGDTCENH